MKQAADPEEERLRIKMRSAKRKMKGVNLQYVADRRVFFDDVAGIGEAKARQGFCVCCRAQLPAIGPAVRIAYLVMAQPCITAAGRLLRANEAGCRWSPAESVARSSLRP